MPPAHRLVPVYSHNEVETRYTKDVTSEVNSISRGCGPKVVELSPRRPANDAEQIADDFKRVSPQVQDVVILYRTPNGDISLMTNQGDSAGAVYFIEQAKLKLLTPTIPTLKGVS